MIGYCNKTSTIWNMFTLGHYHFKCHSNTTTCLSHKNFSISQDKQSLYMNKGFNLFLWHTLINQENLSWMSITRTFARFIKNSHVGGHTPVSSLVPKIGITSGLLQAFSEPQLALQSDKQMRIKKVNCQLWEMPNWEGKRSWSTVKTS